MELLKGESLSVPKLDKNSLPPLPGPVDIVLSAGEVVGVVGGSGSGKTTLLRCIAMLESRALGQITYKGQRIEGQNTPPYRREVLYLPQQPPPFRMTVLESMESAFKTKSASETSLDHDRANALCERLRLPHDIMNRWSPELSVGEAQRLALARALLIEPTILLLDEFTSALDSTGLAEAEALVRSWLCEGQRAAILVSHNDEQLARMTDRSLALDNDEPAEQKEMDPNVP